MTNLGAQAASLLPEPTQRYVEVESVVGEGSSFRVFLPVCDTQGIGSAPDPEGESSPGGHAEQSGSVLVVDDDDGVRRSIRRMLVRSGLSVQEAGDPTEALTALAPDPEAFDVVLTDFSMPTMDGIELARRVREIAPTVPVILMSGSVSDPQPPQGPEYLRYLRKPFRFNELLSAIQDAIETGS